MTEDKFSITLLFNANKVFDRKVLEGIGMYLQTTGVNWDLYLEEDFRGRLEQIYAWQGDGIIADFDDPEIRRALENSSRPVVGVGGSHSNQADYPKVPYVATDNFELVNAAYTHLRQKGFSQFAFYGVPDPLGVIWPKERELAMKELVNREGYKCDFYNGRITQPASWQSTMDELGRWLLRLPKPVGIVAVTDARARHLLQACELVGLMVPDQVSIVGIDDDEVVRNLHKISLTSVKQGCVDIGYKAASILHKMLNKGKRYEEIHLIKPLGVVERASTDYKAVDDPYVIQALHFVRQNACKGIKVEQVADFVGVSRSNLEKRFTFERGHSLHNEIHQVKLNRACELLKTTSLELNDVAMQSGYPSLQYLYAIFKKHFSETPKQYRSNYS
ncbi:XylR family transcriptional regulator [Catenovulum sp. SX2]|uniref:XylR family transcriptional regulator n=1 Tax=Catenovulum sp. SX2 TaxID=3398614 RepID=UPI003F87E5E9